jgi:hypothetical protein
MSSTIGNVGVDLAFLSVINGDLHGITKETSISGGSRVGQTRTNGGMLISTIRDGIELIETTGTSSLRGILFTFLGSFQTSSISRDEVIFISTFTAFDILGGVGIKSNWDLTIGSDFFTSISFSVKSISVIAN